MCTYISVHELMYVLVLVHDNVQCTHVCVNIHTLTYRYTVNMFMKMVIMLFATVDAVLNKNLSTLHAEANVVIAEIQLMVTLTLS